MSNFDQLSKEEKIQLAIKFVARGAKVPKALGSFLKKNGLYDAVVHPRKS